MIPIADATDFLFAAWDRNHHYITFNDTYRATIERYWGVNLVFGMSMREALGNSPLFKHFEDCQRRAMAGETFSTVHEIGPGEHADSWMVTYSPSFDNGGFLIGRPHIGRENAGECAVNPDDDVVGRLPHTRGVINHRLRLDAILHENANSFHIHHDSVTRLPNRLLARKSVQGHIVQANYASGRVALLFLDVDRFKSVNDSLGYVAGDMILLAIAERLKGIIRRTDTLSHMGGDSFMIALSEIDEAEGVAQVIDKIRQAISTPISVGETPLTVSFSIGAALYPDDGNDFDALLRAAEAAMAQAKESGRNTYRFFNEKMTGDAKRYLSIRSDLQIALIEKQLQVHYQPQIDLASGRVVGAEALIRWFHPAKGAIPPGEFIPIAEDCGLIVPIGKWVLAEACRQAAKWRQVGWRHMTVAVNLSAVQFLRGDLVSDIREALSTSGLPAENLELELTESVLIQDREIVRTSLHDLTNLGVKLAIDDFGTGYSNLAYLRKFAVDRIKIDQSFVRDIDTNPNSLAIVHAIIQMTESLGIRTLAEGAEDAPVVAILRQQGCNEVQGYYFGKPMPANILAEFLRLKAPLPSRGYQALDD